MSSRQGTSSRLDALIRQRLGARRVERRAIPARRLTRVELSPVQRQLLAFQTLRPDSTALQIDVVVDVRGPLDVARFDRAFAALCERHPALRSRIDGKHWVIDELDSDAVALVPVPLDAMGSGHVAAVASEPLDITRRLWRAQLVRVGPDHHQLLLRLHHLAADGASIEIMLSDLAALYAGTPGPAPGLWPTDYAAWLWDEIQAGQRDASRDHWQATFARLTTARRLPSAGEAACEGVLAKPIVLTGASLQRMRDVMVAARSSLVGVVSAAINVLIHQWFDVAPVALEVSVANRIRGELDGVVGCFAGAAPVVADVASSARLGEVIEAVQASLAAANEHGEYPLERVPGADVWSGGFGRRVCISVQAASADRRAGDVVLSARMLRSPAPQYDLSFDVVERPDELVVQLESRTQFLDAWRTSALSDALAELLERAGRGGLDTRVREVPARGSTFTLEPARGPSETLGRRFARAAAGREHALAVVAGDVALTYGELRAHSARLANCLRAMGIARGHTVVLYLDRSHWSPIAILGTLMAGATYVPLDASAPPERNAAIAAEVGAALELATPDAMCASAVAIDALALTDYDDTLPACDGHPDDTAYVIYTSGSTGRPKGVAVSHDHVGRVVDAARAHFGFVPGDVWSVFHSFTFDFSVWEMWGALSAGGAMVIVPHWVMRSPREFATLLAQHEVTVVNQTPGALYGLATELAATGAALPSLRHVLVGGEAIVPHRFEAWAARSGPDAAALRVSNIYGITEAVMVSTWWTTSLREFARTEEAPIGAPGIGCELLLLDRNLAPAPRGAVGEIYLGNIALAKGYWRRPDLTAAAFVPHPQRAGARLYRSGDLARTDAEGQLVYVARRDRQVQVRGYRVELGEVETVLRQCGELNDVWVDADERGELVGYVVPRPGATRPDANVAREIALRHLPRHLVPARFVVVDAFPLTDNGKVDTTRLRACVPVVAPTTSRAPATATEREVAAMWQRVLGVAEVGAEDNFFALGGHSLAAAELVYEIREVTRKDLSIQHFFEAPSLSALARRIDESADVASSVQTSEITPATAQERYPASQAQTVLFTTSQSASSARAYALPYAYRITGGVDEAALAAAWRDVVERFEILRTAVALEGDRVWQHVLPVDASPGALDIVTAADVEAAARRIAEDADEPFDLARGEVVRPVLYRCADGYVLGLTVHHIAVDGFAWGRIMADFEAAYRARRAGEHPLLAEVRLHYRDFAVWEARQLASGAFESHRQFWRAYGAGYSTDPGLALGRPSGGGVSFRAALLERQPSHAFAAGLRRVAADAGVTLLAVLMATYSTALARLGTRRNLLIGCVLSGRYRPELYDVVGLFANVLPLRSHAAESEHFATCVARMHADLAAAQAHQALPLNQVLAELRAGGATAPRLHVTLGYQPRDMTGSISTFEPVPLAARALQYDLYLRVDDVDDGLRFAALYNPDRLAATAVARLLADMESLGARAAADPAVEMVPATAFAGLRW